VFFCQSIKFYDTITHQGILQNLISTDGVIMKKVLLTSLVALALSASVASAYELKSNMLLLNAELREVQQGFISSDKEGVKNSIERFAKHANELLGNKEKFEKMLPKNKKNKANEAVMSAQIIAHNVQIILDAVENKYNQSGKLRREESQRAYTYIEHACFRCHNIVRDEN
jgi:cytochrome c556